MRRKILVASKRGQLPTSKVADESSSQINIILDHTSSLPTEILPPNEVSKEPEEFGVLTKEHRQAITASFRVAIA